MDNEDEWQPVRSSRDHGKQPQTLKQPGTSSSDTSSSSLQQPHHQRGRANQKSTSGSAKANQQKPPGTRPLLAAVQGASVQNRGPCSVLGNSGVVKEHVRPGGPSLLPGGPSLLPGGPSLLPGGPSLLPTPGLSSQSQSGSVDQGALARHTDSAQTRQMPQPTPTPSPSLNSTGAGPSTAPAIVWGKPRPATPALAPAPAQPSPEPSRPASAPAPWPTAFPSLSQSGSGVAVLHLDFSSDEESDSSGEAAGRPRLDLSTIHSKMFGAYGLGGEQGEEQLFESELGRIKDHLLAGQSGAAACLICLEKVRATDPVWDCKLGCHVICHLICIQAWARQSGQAAAARASGPLSAERFPQAVAAAAATASWHCPKCRADYRASDVPSQYRCFCEKMKDPPHDPWLAPHTCGDVCARPLPSGCSHRCTLLCHPGPCPPCPKMVAVSCFCARTSRMRRCGQPAYSCEDTCGRALECKLHTCEAKCHAGECPPCPSEGLQKCACGRQKEVRACAERKFHCDEPCLAGLPCGRHKCERVCHAGGCGECPLAGKRFCPCKKVEYPDLPCDAPAPTCGSTCERMLACGLHRCTERCHTGPCVELCRLVITKQCRCGSLTKQVTCHSDLLCERKCQRMRTCDRHACKRRCCDGACPPCSEVCDRKLACKNHKCPAPCHRGPCAPCPVTVRIACACGATAMSVPCGTEKDQRPPKCSRACAVEQKCRHGTGCKPHRCHYGPCPACELACSADLPCGHQCPIRCHGPRPEPRPPYLLRPSKKQRAAKPFQSDEEKLGTPCPPCLVPVVRHCFGKHPGQERTMACSDDPQFRCRLPCNNALPCGNHTCPLECHTVTVPRGARAGDFLCFGSGQLSTGDAPQDANGAGASEQLSDGAIDTCQMCPLLCQKPRDPPCPHTCTQPCHPGKCASCQELIRRRCHCGAHKLLLVCAEFGRAGAEERDRVLSCRDFCHQKLPFCSHLCPEICHSGPCPMPMECKKKVTVRCPCKRLKKEWLCHDAQNLQREREAKEKGTTKTGAPLPPPSSTSSSSTPTPALILLDCDEECLRISREREEARTAAAASRRKREEADQLAAAQSSSLSGVRRRKHRRSGTDADEGQMSRTQEIMAAVGRYLYYAFLLVLLVALVVGAALGLQELSRYMNAQEAVRQRERLERRRRYYGG